MRLNQATPEQLTQWENDTHQEYQQLLSEGLNLDLTRGKPSSDQLSLADGLDGILAGNYISDSGVDVRNYGGLDGLPEAKAFGASILQVPEDNVLAGGNSSLTLMHQAVSAAYYYGLDGPNSAWQLQEKVRFLCPVPGYDRHFSVCQQLGIDMVTVPMTASGPDMDKVEAIIQADPTIKGMWCVPKYSNPTGVIYSEDTVQRIAALANIASEGFRVFWDNAYAVHDLCEQPAQLANIFDACNAAGTQDSVLQFASTSKITHAGAGVAFLAASTANLNAFKQVISMLTIGPDKVNQLRHVRFFEKDGSLQDHMKRHAAIIKPRFESVLNHLQEHFADSDMGNWETADGGYFISFDTQPGLAKEVVKLAGDAGVKLTPAGATFPYGNDPEDRNIRIAPTVPSVEQVDKAMQVFVVCVKLASIRKALTA